jgi:hypothetical protein
VKGTPSLLGLDLRVWGLGKDGRREMEQNSPGGEWLMEWWRSCELAESEYGMGCSKKAKSVFKTVKNSFSQFYCFRGVSNGRFLLYTMIFVHVRHLGPLMKVVEKVKILMCAKNQNGARGQSE